MTRHFKAVSVSRWDQQYQFIRVYLLRRLSLEEALCHIAALCPIRGYKEWWWSSCSVQGSCSFRTQIDFSRTLKFILINNPFSTKISMLILLTVHHTFHSFYLSLTDFQNFSGPVVFTQDFPTQDWTFQSWKMPQTSRTFKVFQDTYKPCLDY